MSTHRISSSAFGRKKNQEFLRIWIGYVLGVTKQPCRRAEVLLSQGTRRKSRSLKTWKEVVKSYLINCGEGRIVVLNSDE